MVLQKVIRKGLRIREEGSAGYSATWQAFFSFSLSVVFQSQTRTLLPTFSVPVSVTAPCHHTTVHPSLASRTEPHLHQGEQTQLRAPWSQRLWVFGNYPFDLGACLIKGTWQAPKIAWHLKEIWAGIDPK